MTEKEICETCGYEMRLQGVGSYHEEGKEPTGARYYFCFQICKKWITVIDRKEVLVGQ